MYRYHATPLQTLAGELARGTQNLDAISGIRCAYGVTTTDVTDVITRVTDIDELSWIPATVEIKKILTATDARVLTMSKSTFGKVAMSVADNETRRVALVLEAALGTRRGVAFEQGAASMIIDEGLHGELKEACMMVLAKTAGLVELNARNRA